MAYPTRNNPLGGSPNQDEREEVGNYMEDTKNYDDPQADSRDTDGQYDQVTVGPYTDRKHPHQDSQDRNTGDHPHQDLNKHSDKHMDKEALKKHIGGGY
jgi:hypothetical protein